MSLFFDREIQKVKERIGRTGLDNLMSQDPRDAESNANKYRPNSNNRPVSDRNKNNSSNRPNRRRNRKY